MLTEENKKQIVAALEAYIGEHALSQNDVIKKTGVNSAYLVAMRKGDTAIIIGGKKTDIGDRYYKKIAAFIGFDIDKQYWKTRNTPQFLRMVSELTEAKQLGETTVVIGDTGSGKSYACEKIQKKSPHDFFRVVVSQSDSLPTLIGKVFDALNMEMPNKKSLSGKIDMLIKKLRDIEQHGYEPMVVFDESEYMRQPALCAMKELHDALDGVCAIGIIGTPQLLRNIDRMVKTEQRGIPQFYRRIKHRIRRLPVIDRNYPDFLNGKFDRETEEWLKRHCDNYGELKDVLLPALREADRLGKPVTLEFIKMILGIID